MEDNGNNENNEDYQTHPMELHSSSRAQMQTLSREVGVA